MKKILFTFKANNVIDVITNSSSELFVLRAKTKEIAEEMIKNIYPDYLKEYEPIESLRDSSDYAIDDYLSWVEHSWFKHGMEISRKRLTKEEKKELEINKAIKQATIYGMTPETYYSNWDKRNEEGYWWAKISSEGLKASANKIDPEGNIFLLWSIDENPDFDMQDALSNIAVRYHLG